MGMYRSANLGDTAIEMALMQALRERLDRVEFIGICAEPEDTTRTYGIAAVEWWGHGPVVSADGRVTWPTNGSRLGGKAGRWLEGLGRFGAIHRTDAPIDG